MQSIAYHLALQPSLSPNFNDLAYTNQTRPATPAEYPVKPRKDNEAGRAHRKTQGSAGQHPQP